MLFDLDGTLTDPKIGITTCVQYALRDQGIEEPDLDKLEPFIGPPLKTSFMELYQLNENQAEQAIEKYRERFQEIGLFENKVYAGIPQMLRKLKENGIHLAVASSKPTVFVQRILEHFHIEQYFEVVVGSELDGTRIEKEEVVQEVLAQLFGDKPKALEEVYMIGDRKFDIEGAKAMSVESVGVSYGYGGVQELKEAGADYIVRSVEELRKFLLREVASEPPKTFLKAIWPMLFPFLMFMLIKNIAANIFYLVTVTIGTNLQGNISDLFFIKDEAGALLGISGNLSTIVNTMSFLVAALFLRKQAVEEIRINKEKSVLYHLKRLPNIYYLYLGVAVVGAIVAINVLFELMQITGKLEAYYIMKEDVYSASLLVGLLCYGILIPIAEEILFRGIIYNHLKKSMKLPMAILISSAMFGFYHMNTIQGVYAFAIGCIMAYGYEYFGTFWVPVTIHIASSFLTYLIGYTPIVESVLFSWPFCITAIVLTFLGFYQLFQQKKIY